MLLIQRHVSAHHQGAVRPGIPQDGSVLIAHLFLRGRRLLHMQCQNFTRLRVNHYQQDAIIRIIRLQ